MLTHIFCCVAIGSFAKCLNRRFTCMYPATFVKPDSPRHVNGSSNQRLHFPFFSLAFSLFSLYNSLNQNAELIV